MGESDHEDSGSSRYGTGVTFPIFFAVVGVFIGTLYCQENDGNLSFVSLSVIIFLGLIGSTHLLYYIVRYRPSYLWNSENIKSWKIRIFFMCIFVLGVIAGEVILGIIDIECWRVTKSKWKIGEVVFRVVNVGYVTSQVVIFMICILRRVTYSGSKYTVLAVKIIIFTNMIFWLVVTVSSASGLYFGFTKNGTNHTSESEQELSCFYNSTGYPVSQKCCHTSCQCTLNFLFLHPAV